MSIVYDIRMILVLVHERLQHVVLVRRGHFVQEDSMQLVYSGECSECVVSV